MLKNVLLLSLLLLFACKSTQKSRGEAIEMEKTQMEYTLIDARPIAQSGILFMVLNMANDSMRQMQVVEVKEGKIVDGTLKRDEFDDPLQMQEGFLLLSFLDENQQVIKSKTIPNPLAFMMEGPGEDKTMEWHFIEKKQADFFLRTLYYDNMKFLKIEHITTNEVLNHLALIKLIL